MKKYTCSACGESGHSKTTCQFVVGETMSAMPRWKRYQARNSEVGLCVCCGARQTQSRLCRVCKDVKNKRKRVGR